MTLDKKPIVIAVRFSPVGKTYYFDASRLGDVKKNDPVIVETSRGWQLGEVVQLIDPLPEPPEGGWKLVDRKASPVDLVQRQAWQRKEVDVVITCRARVAEIGIQGVKIIGAEYSFDGSRLAILFSTETEEKVDLKSLRQDMQKIYTPAQVELRQIGPRDVAKLVGGMGACGLEKRCCSMFLTEFSSISIRMAKEQGISLTPSEITGMCGRLRCCLIYEYEQYVTARAQLPKRNKRVITPNGEGRVVDVNPLRQTVFVEIGELGVREFEKDEIQPAEELEALQKKVQNGCSGGDCGDHQSP